MNLDAEFFDVVEDHNGHRWGWVICTVCNERMRISSTPRNPGTTAKQVRQFAKHHLHLEEALS